MNINSVGINAYRQLDVDNPVTRRQDADQAAQSQQTAKTPVEIAGQPPKTGSALGVKINRGAFDEILSAKEKEALEMIFEKFRSAAAQTATYERNGSTDKPQLGTLVDVTL